MTRTVVCTKELSKTFAEGPVLEDISVTAEAGDVVGVLGQNGAGKTTLLELLLGFALPSKGSAEVFGESSASLSVASKERIGYAPQRAELVDVLTGRHELDLAAAFHRQWDNSVITRLAKQWEVPLEQKVRTLSLGERQKLSLLLAFGHRPDLLILDEPVASLDPITRRQFVTEIVEIGTESQRTVIFSSHIVSDLERVANKIWLLKDGRLAWHGELDAIKESIVRIRIRAQYNLPQDLSVPRAISSRVDGRHAVVTARDWTPDDNVVLSNRLDAHIDVEALSLEEIFVELHR